MSLYTQRRLEVPGTAPYARWSKGLAGLAGAGEPRTGDRPSRDRDEGNDPTRGQRQADKGVDPKPPTTPTLRSGRPDTSVIQSVTQRPDGKYDYIVRDWFRAYPDAATAFRAHGEFLVKNKRYRKAFEQGGDSYRFAAEVARAGYATDPSYERVLTGVMKTLEAAGWR
jgi:hypothetical protein